MINWLYNFWYNYQLKTALKQNQHNKAKKILKQLEVSGNKLSCLASLYKQQLKNSSSLTHNRAELAYLTRQLKEIAPHGDRLEPQPEFINYIDRCFKLNKIDPGLIQSTGIDIPVFTDLEIALAEFVTEEINKVPPQKRDRELNKALEDLTGLKKGIDPKYNCRLTPHLYFLKYFLDNVYCLYLAWFLIYERGLLQKNLKILDLAAGVNTSVFSLAILSSSINRFSSKFIEQISYYSLEQQADLQYRGLQFWRRYIESFATPLNTYFRFNTANLFDYQSYSSKIPKQFFDFVVISHCFFYDSESRERSSQIYRQIFNNSLNPDGRVLLIIQGKKLFSAFDALMSEDIEREKIVVEMFLQELGLKLDWYQYLSSIGNRITKKKQFANFAKNHLYPQKHLSNLNKIYCFQKYVTYYALDDYVILARPLKISDA